MTTRRSTVPARRLADVDTGSIVLAVVGAADAESLDDLMMKAHALLTFEGVRTLVVDLRATTRIADEAVDQLADVVRQARASGRQVRFAGVPDRLVAIVDAIERCSGADASGIVVEVVEE